MKILEQNMKILKPVLALSKPTYYYPPGFAQYLRTRSITKFFNGNKLIKDFLE